MHIELNNALGGVYARLVDITDKHLSPPHGGGALQAGERRETGPSAPFNDCGGVDSDTQVSISSSWGVRTPCGNASASDRFKPAKEISRGCRAVRFGASLMDGPHAEELSTSRCNSGLQSPFITDARIALAVLLAVPVGFMVGAGLCVVFM